MFEEIHQAAAKGDVDTIRRLLEDGVDHSIRNSVIKLSIIIIMKLQVHFCHVITGW